VATPVAVSSVSMPALAGTALSGPLPVESVTAVPYELDVFTLCESVPSFLCYGTVTGDPCAK
jgi:hypothetical protein